MSREFREPLRARRIRERERMVARARKVAEWFLTPWVNGENADERWRQVEERAVRKYNHLKCCSCHMCGNPRRIWGNLTFQELKAEDSARDQVLALLRRTD